MNHFLRGEHWNSFEQGEALLCGTLPRPRWEGDETRKFKLWILSNRPPGWRVEWSGWGLGDVGRQVQFLLQIGPNIETNITTDVIREEEEVEEPGQQQRRHQGRKNWVLFCEQLSKCQQSISVEYMQCCKHVKYTPQHSSFEWNSVIARCVFVFVFSFVFVFCHCELKLETTKQFLLISRWKLAIGKFERDLQRKQSQLAGWGSFTGNVQRNSKWPSLWGNAFPQLWDELFRLLKTGGRVTWHGSFTIFHWYDHFLLK